MGALAAVALVWRLVLSRRFGRRPYTIVSVDSLARGEEHPYTLSSAPAEPHLRIAIRDLGDASRGGIGMTPFVSAARHLATSSGAIDVHLVYCANDPSRAYFLAELDAIAEVVDGLVVHTHYFADEVPRSRFSSEEFDLL